MEGPPQVPPRRQLLPEIVFRKLSEVDDIEVYLTIFEQQVTSENL